MGAHVYFTGLLGYDIPGMSEEEQWDVRTACHVSGGSLRRVFASVGLDMDLYYEGKLDAETCREVAERIQRGEHSLATVPPHAGHGFSDLDLAQDIFCDELSRGGLSWSW